MSNAPDGGQAFPCSGRARGGAFWSNPGMTLLDYFAAHAPASIAQEVGKLSNVAICKALGLDPDKEYGDESLAVRRAMKLTAKLHLEYAKAMLDERDMAVGDV